MAASEKKIKVMLVDDSAVIRGMMTQALQKSPEVDIVASVMNGKAALLALERTPADVVLLDIEMPEMDGITALPLMLKAHPHLKIIMVSSMTTKGADVSMKALELGAVDCLAKPVSKGDKAVTDHFFEDVVQRVIALGKSAHTKKPASNTTAAAAPSAAATPTSSFFAPTSEIRCLAIGSSTGGPQALIQLFRQLQGKKIRVPILITQHMPATFTKILAEHLHAASKLPCEEATEGKEAQAGRIYIAPGDFHLVPRMENSALKLVLNQESPINFCRPAVDPMFHALAQVYGRGLLAVVLTGMGQDGMEGARSIVARGGNVLAQDEATSVVWGMPGAVTKAGLAKAVLPLNDIASTLARVLP
jgi:two-component system chemotaxis response regulator CheB